MEMELDNITEFLLNLVEHLGYIGIFFMTLIESSFVPIPAEFTMIPAGYLVHQGKMNFLLVYFASVAGSVAGGYVNYWIAFHYGRNLFLKYPKIFMMSPDKFDKVEEYFRDHGAISVFTGRLLPAVKHYIGFPAGLAKMNLKTYLFYCLLSGAIWMGLLLGIGYLVGEHQQLIKQYIFWVKIGLLVFVAMLASVYVFRFYNKKKTNSLNASEN